MFGLKIITYKESFITIEFASTLYATYYTKYCCLTTTTFNENTKRIIRTRTKYVPVGTTQANGPVVKNCTISSIVRSALTSYSLYKNGVHSTRVT